MHYNDFVIQIAKKANCPIETVRDVFHAVPSILIKFEENETVKTPVGTFRLVKRPARRVLVPGKEGDFRVEEMMVVRLKPGNRMIFSPPSSSSESPEHNQESSSP